MIIQSVHEVPGGDTVRVVYEGGMEAFVPKSEDNLEYVTVLAWLADGGVITPLPPKSLAEMQLIHHRKINEEAHRRAAEMIDIYPEFERLSWDIQKSEALAYLADPNASVPFLTLLATTRGIPLEELVDKVMTNVTLFTNASATLAGQRQALVDQLYALEEGATQEDVDAIWWEDE